MTRLARPTPHASALALAAAFVLLACLRGLDHDESQYVAAARLVADGLLPYRDFAYLQTPLQPFVLAPVAALAGDWSWAALRIVNALFGATVVIACWRAMREAGVTHRTATAAAGLLAACDILLFSAGTARNDALPAALLALALIPILRAGRGEGTRTSAMLAGLLLAGAATAKISYALPAAAYGLYALLDRRHRPGWIAIGAMPALGFMLWLWTIAPEGFWFGTVTFPARAPAEYYLAEGRAWKLSWGAKALDTAKFLALGPAIVALAYLARGQRAGGVLVWLFAAGAIAALLPAPTWRQYLLPALPPLFVLLALRWQAAPPSRGWRIAMGVFALAGLAPSLVAATSRDGLMTAHRETRALAALGLSGRVATLSPQYLPRALAPDPRFATGPFYFRSTGLLDGAVERRLHLVSRARIGAAFERDPPDFILVGGEGGWTSGNAGIDRVLEDWAIARGWRRIGPPGARLRLYAASARRPSIASR
ncbi:DUF2029 domain-containing protein [Sphingomonas sp.]|uniref:DUF2029 domain-containing protein n=1 Tax=Sphingomonas sp. TaxID=28214 RepID=UPI002DD65AF5|nr:DUF2029 domain-containing protein [Sphingomonas sp.]